MPLLEWHLEMYTALDFFAGSGLVRMGLSPDFEMLWANGGPKMLNPYIKFAVTNSCGVIAR